VQTLLDPYFHFYGRVKRRLISNILNNELFLFGYFVVAAINYHVKVVADPDNDSIVGLKLFFDTVELKIVVHIISQAAGRLQVTHELQEGAALSLVVEVFDYPGKLNSYPHVI
jgi:hypothetical protein